MNTQTNTQNTLTNDSCDKTDTNSSTTTTSPATTASSSHNITWEGVSRVLAFFFHSILVGTGAHVYEFISILRFKTALILAVVCLVAALMVMPIRFFTGAETVSMFRLIIVSDILITVFLLFIAIAFSSQIGFIHQLKNACAIQNSTWYTALAAVCISWICFFFHITILVAVVLFYRKGRNATKNLSSNNKQVDNNELSTGYESNGLYIIKPEALASV